MSTLWCKRFQWVNFTVIEVPKSITIKESVYSDNYSGRWTAKACRDNPVDVPAVRSGMSGNFCFQKYLAYTFCKQIFVLEAEPRHAAIEYIYGLLYVENSYLASPPHIHSWEVQHVGTRNKTHSTVAVSIVGESVPPVMGKTPPSSSVETVESVKTVETCGQIWENEGNGRKFCPSAHVLRGGKRGDPFTETGEHAENLAQCIPNPKPPASWWHSLTYCQHFHGGFTCCDLHLFVIKKHHFLHFLS